MVRIWLASLCLLCCVIYIAKHNEVMSLDALWCLTGLQKFAEFAVRHFSFSRNLYWLFGGSIRFCLRFTRSSPVKVEFLLMVSIEPSASSRSLGLFFHLVNLQSVILNVAFFSCFICISLSAKFLTGILFLIYSLCFTPTF